eukprot:CAMPEP_0185854808 /NCGR_PEP_ID=MMETSP1354-20130828/23551_1 /TAXON_ID=708628 /ORGANISM="Erythrolobus madagascarensis, Strain CCMP3276" /LENGTH=93 /DNA_ID=CAMNT_0028556657 /DNA_START=34 /DNA_END=312 /DNA_ORIENTATION=-
MSFCEIASSRSAHARCFSDFIAATCNTLIATTCAAPLSSPPPPPSELRRKFFRLTTPNELTLVSSAPCTSAAPLFAEEPEDSGTTASPATPRH